MFTVCQHKQIRYMSNCIQTKMTAKKILFKTKIMYVDQSRLHHHTNFLANFMFILSDVMCI